MSLLSCRGFVNLKSVSPRIGYTALPAIVHATRKYQSSQRLRHVVRAEEEEKSSEVDVDSVLKDVQAKWDSISNKSAVFLYGAGTIAALYASTAVIRTVEGVPVLPKLMELVGLLYSSWFIYRYLLFKESREELAQVVTEVKNKISGEN